MAGWPAAGKYSNWSVGHTSGKVCGRECLTGSGGAKVVGVGALEIPSPSIPNSLLTVPLEYRHAMCANRRMRQRPSPAVLNDTRAAG